MMLQNCMKRRRRATRAKPAPSLLPQNILCFKTRLDYRVFTDAAVKGENNSRDCSLSGVRKHGSDASKHMICG